VFLGEQPLGIGHKWQSQPQAGAMVAGFADSRSMFGQ
jgi:hypothetical protein